MEHWKFRNYPQAVAPEPMELGEYAGPIPGRELDRLKLASAVSPDTQVELIRALVAADDRRGGVEVGRHVVGVGDGERGGVQGDDRGVGEAENPLVAAAPRVLDDEVAREVLRLLRRGRTGRRRGGG